MAQSHDDSTINIIEVVIIIIIIIIILPWYFILRDEKIVLRTERN